MLRTPLLTLLIAAPFALAGGCSTPCECPDDDDATADDDDATADDDDTTADDDDTTADDDDTTADDDDTSGDDDDTTEDPLTDADGDGYTIGDGDCDDGDPQIHPGAVDVCDDLLDNDCDEIVDYGCRLHVPEGEFLMGMADDVGGFDQHPQHAVWLDEYWIDKYEVTVGQYRDCEAAGICPSPRSVASFTRTHYYDDPEYDDYPVVEIRRDDARDYCSWVGGYLPTEAQWEKAARGVDDARLYPWGDWYDCTMGNANWCIGDTTKIGAYRDNVSPFGAADMSGNVWEFFDDWYEPGYYQQSPYENPTGPAEGEHISYRGGAFTWWGNPTVSVRHPAREPGSALFNIGFRCAYDGEV